MTTEPVTRIICCLDVEGLCALSHEPSTHTRLGGLAAVCTSCQCTHLVRDQLGLFVVDLNCSACVAHAAHLSARGVLYCYCCNAIVELHRQPRPVVMRKPEGWY